ILQDPDVMSLSSFIGVDGTNATLNTGRFLINLKPRDERTATASDVIRRLRRATAGVPGITLYMQAAQDLTIDTTVSRTQYRVVLEAEPSVQQSLRSLGEIYLPSSLSPTGQVPLSAIAQVREETRPLQVNHLGQFPATTISFNLAPSASLGGAVRAITQAARDLGPPASMLISMHGAAL